VSEKLSLIEQQKMELERQQKVPCLPTVTSQINNFWFWVTVFSNFHISNQCVLIFSYHVFLYLKCWCLYIFPYSWLKRKRLGDWGRNSFLKRSQCLILTDHSFQGGNGGSISWWTLLENVMNYSMFLTAFWQSFWGLDFAQLLHDAVIDLGHSISKWQNQWQRLFKVDLMKSVMWTNWFQINDRDQLKCVFTWLLWIRIHYSCLIIIFWFEGQWRIQLYQKNQSFTYLTIRRSSAWHWMKWDHTLHASTENSEDLCWWECWWFQKSIAYVKRNIQFVYGQAMLVANFCFAFDQFYQL
jgi:hypothetical protein